MVYDRVDGFIIEAYFGEVEPEVPGFAAQGAQVCLTYAQEGLSLSHGESVYALHEGVFLSGADFDEDDGIGFLTDQINFIFAAAPVSREDPHPMFAQVFPGSFFSLPPTPLAHRGMRLPHFEALSQISQYSPLWFKHWESKIVYYPPMATLFQITVPRNDHKLL